MNRASSTSIVILSVALLIVTGCGTSSPSAAAQSLDEKATAVRLQATIYELKLPPDKIGELDAAKLATTNLATSRPAGLGESRALYQIDQLVSLAGDRITVGAQEPMVTNSRMTDKGQRINTVQYNSVGAIVDFKAARSGPKQLEVTSTIEVAAKTDSAVEIGAGVASAVIRKAAMSLKGPVELGKPMVLISGDASSRDKDGNAVVYVARVVLGGASGK